MNTPPTLLERLDLLSKHALATHGWSERELCGKIDVHASYFSKLRERLREDPAYRSFELGPMLRLCEVTRIAVPWLLLGQGPMTMDDPHVLARFEEARHLEDEPGYDRCLASAKLLKPDYPAWVWKKTGRANVILDAALTPVLVAEVAELVVKHVPAPAPEQTAAESSSRSR